MQSTVAWSLNRDVTESRGLGPTQNFQKIHLHLKWCISVRVHPYAHPQHDIHRFMSPNGWSGIHVILIQNFPHFIGI